MIQGNLTWAIFHEILMIASFEKSKLIRWPFLLLVKFFCETMLPH